MNRGSKLEEQPIVKPESYLFNTWLKGTEIVSTQKGDITILEILTDFRSHLLFYKGQYTLYMLSVL